MNTTDPNAIGQTKLRDVLPLAGFRTALWAAAGALMMNCNTAFAEDMEFKFRASPNSEIRAAQTELVEVYGARAAESRLPQRPDDPNRKEIF